MFADALLTGTVS